jgi:hypothetical protein
LATPQQNLHGAAIEVIDSVPTTPTHVRSFPYYFPHIFASRARIQRKALEPIFLFITRRALV